MSKKYKCEKCGHEITLGIKDTEEPDCCGQPMVEVRVAPCRNPGPEATRSMLAEEPCDDYTGNQN